MCDINLEQAELWSETERRARTSKFCSSCDTEIKPGERYVKHFSKHEGVTSSEAMCKYCKAARREFADEHDGMVCTPSYFPEMLSECVVENDEAGSDRWATILEELNARGASRHTKLPDAPQLP